MNYAIVAYLLVSTVLLGVVCILFFYQHLIKKGMRED